MTNQQIKVLCLFDYACTTGFSTVSHNIVHNLRKHFREKLYLDIMAINYFGEIFMEDENTRVISASRVDPKGDAYGRNEIFKIARYTDYDAIFIIQDIEVLNQLGELYSMIKADRKARNLKQAKLLAYFPIDSPPLESFLNQMNVFDLMVTYTDYGRNELIKMRPDWKTRIKVIPHGNNPESFYRVDNRDRVKKFRKDYFGNNADKYIVTCINRNQPRKDIPNTIFSFMDYKKRFNSNAFLYLHMSHEDQLGWNLRKLMEQTPLKEGEDYMFLADDIMNHGASIEVLNMIYNASDVFVTTTLGEGWGLSVTESFACGTPVVAPLHTSLIEISDHGRRFFACSEFRPFCNTWDNIVRDQVDYREVAEQIDVCFSNPQIREAKTVAAEQYMEKLSWKKVCERWIQEFENIL